MTPILLCILIFSSGDPYLNSGLLVYLEGGMADDLLPADPARACAISYMATSVRLHPAWPGWLMEQPKAKKAWYILAHMSSCPIQVGPSEGLS